MKTNMLSRVAEGMFWLNRYMERTDGILLSLQTFYILSFDKEMKDSMGYRPILEYYTGLTNNQINESQYDSNFVLKYIICDNYNVNSVKNLIKKARENARGSQDKITKELWEHINSLYHYTNLPELPKILESYQARDIITKLKNDLLLYNGILNATMPRGLGWCFSNIGKNLDRCLQTIAMAQAYYKPINYNLDGDQDLLYWRRLLLSLSGYEQYLKSYSNIAHNRKIAKHIVFNKDFSHSVIYTLDLIEKYLFQLCIDHISPEARMLQNQFGRLKSKVQYTDYETLTNQQLEEILNGTHLELIQFSNDFSEIFFSYS